MTFELLVLLSCFLLIPLFTSRKDFSVRCVLFSLSPKAKNQVENRWRVSNIQVIRQVDNISIFLIVLRIDIFEVMLHTICVTVRL